MVLWPGRVAAGTRTDGLVQTHAPAHIYVEARGTQMYGLERDPTELRKVAKDAV